MLLMYWICLILTQVTSNLTRKVPLTLSLNPTACNLKKPAASSNNKRAVVCRLSVSAEGGCTMVPDPCCTPHHIQLDNPLMKQILGRLTKTQTTTFNLLCIISDMRIVQVNAHLEGQRSFTLYALTNQQYVEVPSTSYYILVIALVML